ncbi:LuxR family transcriptional regulator [Pantoea sp.]|uniref:helix-turn-helix transcriptional regulator n=1 Tax=Pantoea sp. TaxID=69393 RepID=UPI0028A6C9A0|nr:LuxR family transcriptional regulator [Pantoea sp.]
MFFYFLKNNAVNEIVNAHMEKLTCNHPWLIYAYVICSKKNTTDLAIFSNATEWFNRYVENRYHLIDPVAIRVINEMADFSWSRIAPEIDFIIEENNVVFDEAEMINIQSGHTFILHDPRGNVAALSLISGSETHGELIRIVEEKRGWFQDFLVSMHTRTLELYDSVHKKNPQENVTLTRRESEILSLASSGLSYSKIAEIVNISANTVKFHMANVNKKMGAKNSLQAIGVAMELGLLKK